MNITKIRNALETLGTSPEEMLDRAAKTRALKLSKNFIEAFEISGKLPPERIKVLRKEHEEFKTKLSDEDLWFRDDEGELEETTDKKGRVVDSGTEQDMKITERATAALERIASQGDEKDLEEAILDVVDPERSPHVTYNYDHLPEKAESNVALTEKSVIEAVTIDKGIDNSGQKPEDINEYGSAEAIWEKRRLELKTAGKPTKTTSDEDEVLAAVTKR